MKNFIFSLAMLAIQVMPHKGPDKTPAQMANINTVSNVRMDSLGNIEMKGCRQSSWPLIDGISICGNSNCRPSRPLQSIDIILGSIPGDWGDSTGGIVNIKDSSLTAPIVIRPYRSSPQPECCFCGQVNTLKEAPLTFTNRHVMEDGSSRSENDFAMIAPTSKDQRNYSINCCCCRSSCIYIVDGIRINGSKFTPRKAEEDEFLFALSNTNPAAYDIPFENQITDEKNQVSYPCTLSKMVYKNF